MFKKYVKLVVTIGVPLFLSSCVDDDICDKELTPKLVVKITDTSGNTLSIDSLYIDKKNIKGEISKIGVFTQTDSLKIPLDALTEETIFLLYNRNETPEADKDIIVIKYNTEQKFVSKACGLKVIFKNVIYNLENSVNIKKLTSNTSEITNETTTHLYISY